MNSEVQNITQEGLNWSKRNPDDLRTRKRSQNEESEMKTDQVYLNLEERRLIEKEAENKRPNEANKCGSDVL